LTSQSLTDEERLQIGARIAALEIEHQDLDDVIARLAEHPSQDQLQLRRLKKRKLVLKDSISRLKILLVPDIPA
jgi:hypothetical protein